MLAVNTLFLILHSIGIEGHPRRVFISAEIFIGLHNFANVSLPALIFILNLGVCYNSKSSSGSYGELNNSNFYGSGSLCLSVVHVWS